MSSTGDRDVVLAVFCLVLSSFHVIEGFFTGIIAGLYNTFQQAWILWIRPVSDLGVWLLGVWSVGFTPAAILYAVILAGLGVAAYRGLSERVVIAAVAFFGANLFIYRVLTVFWVQYGGLFEFLIGDILYSLLMLTGIGLFIVRSPSEMSLNPMSRRPTMDPASRRAESVGTRTGAEPGTRADTTGTGRAADASASVSESQGSRESAPEGGETTQAPASSDDEGVTRERELPGARDTSPATSGDDTRPAPDVDSMEVSSSGAPAPSDGDEKSEMSPETIVNELEEQAVTPEKIIKLGETLSGGELSDDVATILERHADADDPDIRLAVCRVCAELEDERASDLLRRLRIDPDTRVANVAINGLK